MTDVPEGLAYTQDHEWVRLGDDGEVVIGITDHAQQQLGELVYIELPEVGRMLAAGDAMAVVESTKAASDVYAPVAGEVVAINGRLNDEPGLANAAPYAEGWLARLRPTGRLEGLLDAQAYAALLAGSAD